MSQPKIHKYNAQTLKDKKNRVCIFEIPKKIGRRANWGGHNMTMP